MDLDGGMGHRKHSRKERKKLLPADASILPCHIYFLLLIDEPLSFGLPVILSLLCSALC